MGRLGMKELAQALPAFPTGPIQTVEEPGLFGNPVPQEVFAQKQGAEIEADAAPDFARRDQEMDMELEMGMGM
jgi:hypothetical protein